MVSLSVHTTILRRKKEEQVEGRELLLICRALRAYTPSYPSFFQSNRFYWPSMRHNCLMETMWPKEVVLAVTMMAGTITRCYGRCPSGRASYRKEGISLLCFHHHHLQLQGRLLLLLLLPLWLMPMMMKWERFAVEQWWFVLKMRFLFPFYFSQLSFSLSSWRLSPTCWSKWLQRRRHGTTSLVYVALVCLNNIKSSLYYRNIFL